MSFLSRFTTDIFGHETKHKEAPPKGEDASVKSVLMSRRDALRKLVLFTGALAASGASLPGCDFRHQNFNIHDYPRFNGEPPYPEIPLEDAQIMALLTETIQSEFGFCPDFSQFFSLSFVDQKILITLFIAVKKDPLAAKTLLKEAGFEDGDMTINEDGIEGITLKCDKNGRHLDITINMNSRTIYINGKGKTDHTIQSNSVVAKLYPSWGNKGEPTAITIDVSNTKISTHVGNGVDHSSSSSQHQKVNDGANSKPYKESDGIDQNISSVEHTQKVIGGDGSRAFWAKASGYFQFQKAGSDRPLMVKDGKSFLEFLYNCQCREMLRQILSTENPFYDATINRTPFFGDIDLNETTREIFGIREILGLFPKNDLDLWGRFLKLALVGQAGDRSLKDEYRHPTTTLQSGWADCDDYAVLNAFWSYLHGYAPFIVHIDGVHFQGKDVGHIFVWYWDPEQNRVVVLDNTTPTVLEEGETVEDYIKNKYPGSREVFNVGA